MTDWSYGSWTPVDPANWGELRHDHPSEQDCHVDLGAGRLKKGRIGIDVRPCRGINIVMDLNTGGVLAQAPESNQDAVEHLNYTAGYRYRMRRSPGYVDYRTIPLPGRGYGEQELYVVSWGLPFETSSIKSIISHHALEHVGAGFLPLMDEVYRVLEPGGTFRAITPLFPSYDAVTDPDHCRYFTEGTWLSFCGHLGDAKNPTGSWLDSFSVPYTAARFEMTDQDVTARFQPDLHWTPADTREMRVTLKANK